MIRRLVQDAVLEAFSHDVQNLILDQLVALELLVGFEVAHVVVGVALIDGRHATELLMVPRIFLF